MSQETFEERDAEVREAMEEEGYSVYEAHSGKELFEEGIESLDLSRGRKGGKVILPNERLAVFWRRIFTVQFSDGGWRDTESGHQFEHWKPYAHAQIVVDKSRTYPKFECYHTHEKMDTPLNHFDSFKLPLNDMIYYARILTGDDSYDMSDLKDDLRLFDNMQFNVADIEKCSQCGQDIY